MQTKYKLQILTFILATLIIMVILGDLLFIKKPLRQQQAVEKKQRIIIPFQELKNQYK